MNRASFNAHEWVFILAEHLGKRPEGRKLESAAAVGGWSHLWSSLEYVDGVGYPIG